MELAVANLEYDGKVEDFVNGLLTIDPLYRTISKVSYVSGKIKVPWRAKLVERNSEIIRNWIKDLEPKSELTYVVPEVILHANRKYIPYHGRLLVLTSYPMVENFLNVLEGYSVLGVGYSFKKPENYLLRKISETFRVYGASMVTNFFHGEDNIIGTIAHELGHTSGLKHHSDCVMSYSVKSTEFCDSCKNILSTF